MDGDIELGVGKTCFIVSPIGSKLEPVGSAGRSRWEESIFMWENVFEPACAAFGLTPVRADKISESGEIPEQIFTYLRDAEVVIADVSHANPNVMYELGLRHTRPGITLQVGEFKLLPFDVTTIRTIQFNRTEAGLISARDDLIVALRTALKGGGTPLRVKTIWDASPRPAKEQVAEDSEASRVDDDDWGEPGSMDILADGERAITEIAEAMNEIGALTGDIGNVMTEQTAAVQYSDGNQGGFAGRVRIARELNEALAGPGGELEIKSNIYYEGTRTLDAMVDYLATRIEANDDDEENRTALIQFAQSFVSLADSASQAAVGTTTFREAIRNLRQFSRDLRPSVQVLDRATSRILEGFAIMSGWREKLADWATS